MSFIDGYADGSFIGYLAQQLDLDENGRPLQNEWHRFGNTIGVLALRLGLLTSAQVDELLERQEAEGGYFGELATEAGYLIPAQVATLLELQGLHDELFLAEQLVISGKLDVPSLLNSLTTYRQQVVEPAP